MIFTWNVGQTVCECSDNERYSGCNGHVSQRESSDWRSHGDVSRNVTPCSLESSYHRLALGAAFIFTNQYKGNRFLSNICTEELRLSGLIGTAGRPSGYTQIPDNWIFLWRYATLSVCSSAVTIYSMYSRVNKNPSAWNFLSPKPEVTCGTVAIIIRVVLLSPYLRIRALSLSSIHYNQSHRVYINRRRQYICLIWN